MSITVDPITYVINVPRDDLSVVQLTPTEIRTMDLNWFRMQLHDLMDDEDGMPLLKMFTHNTEVELGGITYARIVEILDPYSVTFEDGQYAVNLTGANSNVADKTNVNQVSVRPQNSAGLISSADIEYGAFNGGITYDETDGYPGTGQISNGANIGTPRAPSNNMHDTRLIAEIRGFRTVYVIGNMDMPEYEEGTTNPFSISDYTFIGSGKSSTIIDIPAIAEVNTCKYYDAHITGTLDGFNTLTDCVIDNLQYIKGYLDSCVLSPGIIALGGNDTAHFLDCFSGVPGEGTPTIDFGGSGQALAMRNYNGGILLQNKTGTDSASIDLNSGQVIIDLTTMTNGIVVIRGIGKVIDQDDNPLETGFYGSLYILNEAMNQSNISSAVWDEPISKHLVGGTTGLSVGIAQFGGKVTIDIANGTAGTEFPIGTDRVPSNNLDDAMDISASIGSDKFYMIGDITFDVTEVHNGHTFIGNGQNNCTVTIDDALFIGCTFESCVVNGNFADGSILEGRNANFTDVTNLSGNYYSCILGGYVSLSNASSQTVFYDCYDAIPGIGIPDVQVRNCLSLGIWNWQGGIRLSNMTEAATVVSLMIAQGRLFVEETDVAGDIIVKGMADLRGETGGTTIDDSGIIDKSTIAEAVLDADITNHQTTDTVGHIFMRVTYGGKVFIDTSSAHTGTLYPIGTNDFPVNNIDDALTIARFYSCHIIHARSDITIETSNDISHMTIEGHTQIATVTCNEVLTNSSTFNSVYITGTISGRANYYACHMKDLAGVAGFVDECQLQGHIYLDDASATNETLMHQCSAVDLTGPTIHTGTETLICTQMSGRVTIADLTGGVVGLGGDFCQFVLDSSCSGGVAAIGTKGTIINESTGTYIALENSLTPDSITDAVWSYERTP